MTRFAFRAVRVLVTKLARIIRTERQSKLVCAAGENTGNRLVNTVRTSKKTEVIGRDSSLLHQPLLNKCIYVTPILLTHENYGKVRNLSRLNERHCFKELIKRSKAARHDDKGKRVLHKKEFPHVEVPKRVVGIQVAVGPLLMGETDIAAN